MDKLTDLFGVWSRVLWRQRKTTQLVPRLCPVRS